MGTAGLIILTGSVLLVLFNSNKNFMTALIITAFIVLGVSLVKLDMNSQKIQQDISFEKLRIKYQNQSEELNQVHLLIERFIKQHKDTTWSFQPTRFDADSESEPIVQ